jgi:hypothetical protein
MSELLEGMSPAQLGQAVPYIRIHELTAAGGQGAKLTTDVYTPPKFGQPLDRRFGERPDVSIENLQVKYMMPRGWILYRELEFNITVHNPDAVFRSSSGSLMSSLLDFNKSHIVYYGWSGGSSVLSNGPPAENPDPVPPDPTRVSGYQDYTRGMMIAHNPIPGTQDSLPANYRDVIPVKAAIRFKVTNYNFTIEPDMQVKFHIHAIEDGEIATRDAVIFNNRNILPIFDTTGLTLDMAGPVFDKISSYFINEIMERSKDEYHEIEIEDKKDPSKPPAKQMERFIKLEHVFNIFFADPIVYSMQALGYKNPLLELGLFNRRCPTTTAAYGKFDYAMKPIADFLIPVKKVSDLVARMITANSQMTAYGMIREFCGILNNPEVWQSNSADKKMIPELVLRTRYNPDTGTALFQLIDRKYYIANNSFDIEATENTKRSVLKGMLKNNNIPYLRLMTQLSYFKDVKFDVVNDEQMKSIMINRAIAKTRADIATGDARNSQLYGGQPGFAMMYRSAIKGTLTMLGNFAFDVFGIVWFEFGIPAYDGLFYVLARTDNVNSDGFFTTLTLQAEGSDPLRYAKFQNTTTLPKWVTGDGNRSMYDWVKSMILKSDPEAELARIEQYQNDNGI